MNRFKKIFVAGILGLVGLVSGCTDSNPEGWKTFIGEIGNYNVRIEETNYSDYSRRTVHIENNDQEADPYAISGHDYDGDKIWDRLFIRKKYADGYTSIEFKNKERTVWDPMPIGAKSVTSEQVSNAKKELDKAMEQIYRPENMTKEEKNE